MLGRLGPKASSVMAKLDRMEMAFSFSQVFPFLIEFTIGFK